MSFVETILHLEPSPDAMSTPPVTIDVSHGRVESSSIRIDFATRTIETRDSFGHLQTIPMFGDKRVTRGRSRHHRFPSHDYSRSFLEVFRCTPVSEVITPVRLLYRDPTSGMLLQALQPITGTMFGKTDEKDGMMDSLPQHLYLKPLYEDVALPRSWGVTRDSDETQTAPNDRSHEKYELPLDNTTLSFKSESTEKLLAQRNGFNPNDSQFRIPSSLAASEGIDVTQSPLRLNLDGLFASPSRPATKEFRIPVFNIEEEIRGLTGKKRKRANSLYNDGIEKVVPADCIPEESMVRTDDAEVDDDNPNDDDYVESVPGPAAKRKKGGSKTTGMKGMKTDGQGSSKKRGRKPNIPSLQRQQPLGAKQEFYPAATEVAEKKFTKAPGPRKKTGCWTCRLRRKKCTEERPACAECVRLGLQCQGYGKERPAFMTNSELAKKMMEEIKRVTLTQKRRGSKQRYQKKLQSSGEPSGRNEGSSRDATIDQPI
ncbi:DEKNAAC100357 [Brettanomyces naardenensis]|uniref:DEKNAAC100357 n=1 Tax=Brettanomyces naardenensis TaxID=13370 RepID=A0A448YFI9_BRENA|nr:DEKNAAC100357 [Brettanomyces naardenensis]